jgi:SET domain
LHPLDGEDWFTARPYLGPVPLTNDLDEATAVFAKFTELQETLTRSHVADALTIATDVWTTFVKDTAFRDSRVLRGGFKHDDADFLHQLTTLYDNDVTAAHVAASTRSIEWLRRYGTCADHMVAQPSTVPQAGMGAFATRTIPTDTIVAYMPLLFIADRTCLEMFKLGPSQKGQWAPIDDTVIGQQLLLNYCYGHAESTVLLCPYGSMVNYVNHNQSRANVRVQWGRASKGNFVPDLLNQTVDAIESSGSVTGKLAMEMVATREIQPGEEILMDYGDEWEAAWTAHVRDWQPVPGASTYKSALQLEEDTTSRLRSIYQELRNKTYSDNVQMMCDTAIDTKPAEVEMHYRAGTLDEYLYQPDAEWWPCSILHSRVDEKGINGEYVYTIHLHELGHGERPSSGVLIENVPRGVIHFVDLPGSSDTYLPNAFRHDLRVPDSLFPLSWRNAVV